MMARVNPVTLTWHAADLLMQAKAPRWLRVLYALLGLTGNLVGVGHSVEISRARANHAVDVWLTSSHPITRN